MAGLAGAAAPRRGPVDTGPRAGAGRWRGAHLRGTAMKVYAPPRGGGMHPCRRDRSGLGLLCRVG